MNKVSLVDFHCHILPCVDDGSRSVEESLAMLEAERGQGVTHVVATPHFYPQYSSPESFLKKRYESEMLLRERLSRSPELPDITMGAEVYFFRGISESNAISGLTIGKNKYILVEMPLPPWTESMYKELSDIYTKQGITPIIAHVDRYIGPFRSFGIPEKLEELPVLVQANASFFTRTATKRMALRMLKDSRIHLLGSDSHNTESRPPNLGDAASVILDKMGERAITRINYYEQKVLFGTTR